MANTFTQIHIHVVFAVQNRVSLIQKTWQEQLYKYIITIIQKHGHRFCQSEECPITFIFCLDFVQHRHYRI